MPNTRWRITTMVKNPKNALNTSNAAWRHSARSRRNRSRFRSGRQVEMPARVQPLPVTPDKQLSETTPPCVLRTTRLEHDLKAPIEHDDIAKSLRLCFRKHQTDESTSSLMKRSRSIKGLGAVREGAVVHVDTDELLGQDLAECLHIAIVKRPPRCFACDQHLRIDHRVRCHLQTGP